MEIAHRDIKPGNIMINLKTLNIKYLDFGLSISKNICKNNIIHLGTLAYVSPEGVGMNYEAAINADLWSLGKICLELILKCQNYFLYAKEFVLPMQILNHYLKKPNTYHRLQQLEEHIYNKALKKSNELFDKNVTCKIDDKTLKDIHRLFISYRFHKYFTETIAALLCENPNDRKIILQENLSFTK